METITGYKAIKEDIRILLKNASLLTVSQVALLKSLEKHLKRTGSLSEKQEGLIYELKMHLEEDK